MTTFVQFQPNPNGPFVFTATLDGNLYNITVVWNLFGRRYYVLCQDLNGNLIFLRPLIGSPTGIAIQDISWNANLVTLIALAPHGFRPGQTAKITIAGTDPDGYNGTFVALATGPTSLTFPLDTNPGTFITPGIVNQDLDIAASYFTTSTLVYREGTGMFEITP